MSSSTVLDGGVPIADAVTVSHPPVSVHHARRWWILVMLSIAQLMVVLDATVVNIALPTAQHALGFSNSNRQWIVTAYALAFGSLLLIGGRLADLIGRKRIFLIGLAGFAGASALGGAATSFDMLVTARAVQGVFGALLAPAALAILTTTFTESRERGRAFGIYGAVAGVGAAVGLLLGGILTEYASWRWTMFINVFFAGIAFTGGALLLHHIPSGHRPRLDWPGTITVSAGLFALVYGFSHANTHGWADTVTIAFLVASALLLAAFVAVQRVSRNPLLPLRVVLDRNRGGAFLAMFTAAAGMFGVFLFLTYYLQQTLGYSAVSTGLAFLPMSGLLIVSASVVSTVLAGRISPRILIPTGLTLAAVAMVLLTRLGLHSTYVADVLPATLLMGIGLGLVFATGMSTATLGVAADDSGVASASVNVMQQVGGSVGTALLNTLAASAVTAYVHGHLSSGPLKLVQASAAVHGYTTAFWWSAGIFALGTVLTALTLRSGVPQIDPDADPIVVG